MKTTNGLQRLGITLCGLSALALVGCGGDSDYGPDSGPDCVHGLNLGSEHRDDDATART